MTPAARAAVLGLAVALASAACDPAAAPDRASISQAELLERLESDSPPLLLDVRRPDEFASGHIPGAVNVPHTEIGARIGDLGPSDRHVVVYCQSGRRSAIAESVLREAGFADVLHLEGDMQGWRAAGLPCEGC